MFHRHKSFFPIVLGALTIGLITLFVYSSKPAEQVRNVSMEPAQQFIAPSEGEYESGLKDALQPYFKEYDGAENNGVRIILIESTLSDVLDLRLPTTYKELHLDIAVALNLISTGLRAEGGDVEAGRARIDALAATYSWMK
jgi:hypothetical protein